MKVKQTSTGDWDSLEDIFIAMGNLRTEDGKLLGYQDAWKATEEFAKKIGILQDHAGFLHRSKRIGDK